MTLFLLRNSSDQRREFRRRKYDYVRALAARHAGRSKKGPDLPKFFDPQQVSSVESMRPIDAIKTLLSEEKAFGQYRFNEALRKSFDSEGFYQHLRRSGESGKRTSNRVKVASGGSDGEDLIELFVDDLKVTAPANIDLEPLKDIFKQMHRDVIENLPPGEKIKNIESVEIHHSLAQGLRPFTTILIRSQ